MEPTFIGMVMMSNSAEHLVKKDYFLNEGIKDVSSE
jgi:hypothetical protein